MHAVLLKNIYLLVVFLYISSSIFAAESSQTQFRQINDTVVKLCGIPFHRVNTECGLVRFEAVFEKNTTGNVYLYFVTEAKGFVLYFGATKYCDGRVCNYSFKDFIADQNLLNSLKLGFDFFDYLAYANNQSMKEKFLRHVPIATVLLEEHRVPGAHSSYFPIRVCNAFATAALRKVALLVRMPFYAPFLGLDIPPLTYQMRHGSLKEYNGNKTALFAGVGIDALLGCGFREFQRSDLCTSLSQLAPIKSAAEFYQKLPEPIRLRIPNAVNLARTVLVGVVTQKLLKRNTCS